MFLYTEDGKKAAYQKKHEKSIFTETAHRDVAALHPTAEPLILLVCLNRFNQGCAYYECGIYDTMSKPERHGRLHGP